MRRFVGWLDKIVAEQAWSDDTLLGLALAHIMATDPKGFRARLLQVQTEENEEWQPFS